ncbi:MAG: hypothetical protein K2Y71_25385 [Xanthobacteraceae bacterium]|nr:hypothetical protein [Xanthobacteraceae bacterium]
MAMNWKSVIPTAALAGLACITLLSTSEPSAAKTMTCGQKATDCAERCGARFKDDPAQLRSCGERTCNHQYKMCVNNSVGGGSSGSGAGSGGGKAGPIVRDKRPKRPPPRGGSVEMATASSPQSSMHHPPSGPTPRPLPAPVPTPTSGQPTPKPWQGPIIPAHTSTGAKPGGKMVVNVRDHRAPRKPPVVRGNGGGGVTVTANGGRRR